MFQNVRKLVLQNRLARLMTNGKDNQRVRNKILRELKKYS